jgi:hypothetical protein
MCRETFGQFRGEDFYEETVHIGESYASIFVCRQISSRMDQKSVLYLDGTFGVLPMKFKQLLIVMGDVQGKVSSQIIF